MNKNALFKYRFRDTLVADFSNTTIFVVVSLRAASTVIFYNKCKHPVWPGIQPSAGQNLLAGGGFKLPANKAHSLQLPPLWSGRFWGRHGCTFDRSGRGHCATGDCGGSLSCNGAGGEPPATLAEITLGPELDFYDVSLVDGSVNLTSNLLSFLHKLNLLFSLIL